MLSCPFSLSSNNISVFNWLSSFLLCSFQVPSSRLLKWLKHPFWYSSGSAGVTLAIRNDMYFQSVIWIVMLVDNQNKGDFFRIFAWSLSFWLKRKNYWTWHHLSSGRRRGRLQKAYRPEERQASCLLIAADWWICGQSHRSGLWAQSCSSS